VLLDEAERLAHGHMEEWGLLDNGWRFVFDNARSRFGQCSYRRRVISLSKHLVALNGVEEVNDTILHEIAHALTGAGHHHDHVWKDMCVRVGAKPETCYDSDLVQRPAHRWEGHCTNPNCDMVYKRQRLRKHIRYGASCGKCKLGYSLKWVDVSPPITTKHVVEFVDELPEDL